MMGGFLRECSASLSGNQSWHDGYVHGGRTKPAIDDLDDDEQNKGEIIVV